MGNVLAHGSGLELIVWVMGLVGWVLGVVLVGLMVSLGIAAVLARVVKKRHLFWLVPLVSVGIFLLAWKWVPLPEGTAGSFVETTLKRVAAVGIGLGALVSAALMASLKGAAQTMLHARQRIIEYEPTPLPPAGGPPPLPGAGPPALPEAAGALAPAGTWWEQFKRGFVTPMEGLVYLNRNPALWKYAVLPVVVNLLITLLVLAIVVGAGVWFAVWLHPRFPQSTWGVVLEVLAAAAILIAALGVAMGAWVVLGGIISGHFYAKLAKRVEMQLGMREQDMREVSLRYQIADSFRDLGALIVINGGLLLLNFVPVIGSIVAFPLGIYLDGFLFGYDYVDLPMSLRGMRRADKRARAREHRWEVVGLGASAIALNLVPVVGSVLLATAAAGAVLMHRRWEGAPLSTVAAPAVL